MGAVGSTRVSFLRRPMIELSDDIESGGARLGEWYVSACQRVGRVKKRRAVGAQPGHPSEKAHERAWRDYRLLDARMHGISPAVK